MAKEKYFLISEPDSFKQKFADYYVRRSLLDAKDRSKEIGNLMLDVYKAKEKGHEQITVFIESSQGQGNTWFLEDFYRRFQDYWKMQHQQIEYKVIPFKSSFGRESQNPVVVETLLPNFRKRLLKKLSIRFQLLSTKRKLTFIIGSILLLLIIAPLFELFLYWFTSNPAKRSFIEFLQNISISDFVQFIATSIGIGTFVALVLKILGKILSSQNDSHLLSEDEKIMLKDAGRYTPLKKELLKRGEHLLFVIDAADRLDDFSKDFFINILGKNSITGNRKSVLVFLFSDESEIQKHLKKQIRKASSKMENLIEYKLKRFSLEEMRMICKKFGINDSLAESFPNIKALVNQERPEAYNELQIEWEEVQNSKGSNTEFTEVELLAYLAFSGPSYGSEHWSEEKIQEVFSNAIFVKDHCQLKGWKSFQSEIALEKLIIKLKDENYKKLFKRSEGYYVPTDLRFVIKESFPTIDICLIHDFWFRYYYYKYRTTTGDANTLLNLAFYHFEQEMVRISDLISSIDKTVLNNFIKEYLEIHSQLATSLIENTRFKQAKLVLENFISTLLSLLSTNFTVSQEIDNSIQQGLAKCWEYFYLTGSSIILQKLEPLTKALYIIKSPFISNEVNLLECYTAFLRGANPSDILNNLSKIDTENSKLKDSPLFELLNYLQLMLQIRTSCGFIDECAKVLSSDDLPIVRESDLSIFEFNLRFLIAELYKSLMNEDKILDSLENLSIRCSTMVEKNSSYGLIDEAFYSLYTARILHILIDFLTSQQHNKTCPEKRRREIFEYGDSELFPNNIELGSNPETKQILSYHISNLVLEGNLKITIPKVFDWIREKYEEAKFLFQLFGLETALIEAHFHYGCFLCDYSNNRIETPHEPWWEKWRKDEFESALTLQNQLGLRVNLADIHRKIFLTFDEVSHSIYLKDEISDFCRALKESHFPLNIYAKYLDKKRIIFINHPTNKQDYETSTEAALEWLDILAKHSSEISSSNFSHGNLEFEKADCLIFLAQDYRRLNKYDEAYLSLANAKSILSKLKITPPAELKLDTINDSDLLLAEIEIDIKDDQKIKTNDLIKNFFHQNEWQLLPRFIHIINKRLSDAIDTKSMSKDLVLKCIELIEQHHYTYSSLAGPMLYAALSIAEWYVSNKQVDIEEPQLERIKWVLQVSEKSAEKDPNPEQLIELCDVMIQLDPLEQINYMLKQDNWLAIKAEGEYRQNLMKYYERKGYREIFKNYLAFFKRHLREMVWKDYPQTEIKTLLKKEKYEECIGLIEKWLSQREAMPSLVTSQWDNLSDDRVEVHTDLIDAYETLYECSEATKDEERKDRTIKKLNQLCEFNIPTLLRAVQLSPKMSPRLKETVDSFLQLHEGTTFQK